MKRIRKPTPALKQAAEFCRRAQAIKAGKIPDDCRTPWQASKTDAGRERSNST